MNKRKIFGYTPIDPMKDSKDIAGFCIDPKNKIYSKKEDCDKIVKDFKKKLRNPTLQTGAIILID